MKSLKTSISILAVLILMISAAHIYLNYSSNKMDDIISSAEKYALSGNTEMAAKRLDEFSSEWNHSKHIFATFIRHAEIDLANQSAAKLSSYLEEEDKSDFIAECETLRMQIKHIEETEQFSLDNIL